VPLDVAIPPKKVSATTVLGFGGYAINKNTKNADLAKALMLELVSLESQTEEGDGGGGVPGRKSALSETFLSFPPSADLYYKTLDDVKAVPSPANFQEVEKIFIRHYTAMMADEVSIADGCKQAHDELNESFARLKAQA
jgi:multiple sugar transport system substrate-binding protein